MLSTGCDAAVAVLQLSGAGIVPDSGFVNKRPFQRKNKRRTPCAPRLRMLEDPSYPIIVSGDLRAGNVFLPPGRRLVGETNPLVSEAPGNSRDVGSRRIPPARRKTLGVFLRSLLSHERQLLRVPFVIRDHLRRAQRHVPLLHGAGQNHHIAARLVHLPPERCLPDEL